MSISPFQAKGKLLLNLNESQSIRETFGDEDIEGGGDGRMNLL